MHVFPTEIAILLNNKNIEQLLPRSNNLSIVDNLSMIDKRFYL